MKLIITAACLLGQVREKNEDMALVGDLFVRDGSMSHVVDLSQTDRYLVAVADGMGGHSCGEVASSDVLHNLQYFISDFPAGLSTTDYNECIYEWLVSINHIIDAKGHLEREYRGMGTTLVAFVFYCGRFYWMNCGDSRFYRFRDNRLYQVSTDHSLNTLVGEDKHSHIITNCIGGGCSRSFIDIVEYTDDVKPNDLLLLCSDGLSDMIPDEFIQNQLCSGADANALCLTADRLGGLDNITAVTIKIVE